MNLEHSIPLEKSHFLSVYDFLIAEQWKNRTQFFLLIYAREFGYVTAPQDRSG